MTYKEFIDSIVLKRGHHPNFNKKVSGFEIHHIVPKCMGGDNSPENLVLLTIGEHLKAHTLLYRENKDNKDLFVALHLMSNEIDTQELLNAVDAEEEFEELVQSISEVRLAYNVQGENNPMYGKHHTKTTRKIMSEKKRGKYFGEENPHWGKKHAKEMKKKLSAERTGGGNPCLKKFTAQN